MSKDKLHYYDYIHKYMEIYKEPEVWKRFIYKGYETPYKVSNYGRIYNVKKNKFVNPVRIGKYYRITLYCPGFKRFTIDVQRIVALAFIDIPQKYRDMGLTENDLAIDHRRDGEPDNHEDNTMWNLQWLTPAENSAKVVRSDYRSYNKINRRYDTLTQKEIDQISRLIMQGITPYPDISKKFSISVDTIRKIKNKEILQKETSAYNFALVNEVDRITNRNKYPIELRNDISDMIKRGCKNSEIYDMVETKYGYSKPAIKSYVQYKRRELGILLKEHTENDGLFVKQIDELLRQGKTNDEIVDILDMPDDTRASRRLLQYRRAMLGIPALKSKYFSNEESDKINELLKTSMTYDEIVDKMGFRDSPYLDKIYATMRSRRCQLQK